MQCSKCRNEAILFQPYSGQHLCREHFIADFEAKAKRTLRQQRGMRPGDSIAVFLTGDAASEALLLFFEKVAGQRRDVRFFGIAMDGTPERVAIRAAGDGYSRIAIATSLEDGAASVLARILQGRADGLSEQAIGGIPVIAPFSHIPEAEVHLYARLHGIAESEIWPLPGDALLSDVKSLLCTYSHSHPQAPYAVQNIRDALLSCDGKADPKYP